MARLADAVQRCLGHKLELRTQLVPAGHSDGVWWRTLPQCQHCGVTRSVTTQPGRCPICGTTTPPIAARKHRVLGNRPYLNLAGVIGDEAASQLQQRLT